MFRGCDLEFGRRARRAVVAGFVAALLVSCAGATPTYEGPRKPPAEVAIISVDVRVKIVKLDGRKVNGGSYEVLPGEHRVDVKITFLGEEISGGLVGLRRTCYANAKFIADPGQEYRVMRISKQGKKRDVPGFMQYTHDWGASLQNLTTGEHMQEAMSEMSCGV